MVSTYNSRVTGTLFFMRKSPRIPPAGGIRGDFLEFLEPKRTSGHPLFIASPSPYVGTLALLLYSERK